MSHDSAEPRETAPARVVRTALRRFVLSSVVAVVLLVAVSVFAADRLARTEALRNATVQAQGLAGFVAGQVTPALRAGDPAARASLDAIIEPQLTDGDLRHVKLWSSSGMVLWSDQGSIIGRTFTLPPEGKRHRSRGTRFGGTTAPAEPRLLRGPAGMVGRRR